MHVFHYCTSTENIDIDPFLLKEILSYVTGYTRATSQQCESINYLNTSSTDDYLMIIQMID